MYSSAKYAGVARSQPATRRKRKLSATMPPRTWTAPTWARIPSWRRGVTRRTARASAPTPPLSARAEGVLTERLYAVLLVGALIGDEELAVRAFEALVAVRPAGEELGLERLLAVGADHLVRGLLLGRMRHAARIAL